MGSFKRPRVFEPLDLEIIEHAYEAAWAEIVLRDPERDTSKDNERKLSLRKRMFATVSDGIADSDTLRDKVLARTPDYWAPSVPIERKARKRRGRAPID
jgi:hypothetical protein